MLWSYEFQDYELDVKKVILYGFNLIENQYIFYKDTIENFKFKIVILPQQNNIEITVMDIDNEVYIPFSITTATGPLVQSLRFEAELLLEDIKKNCFILRNIRKEIFSYIQNKYNTIPEYLFKDSPSAAVLKAGNGKWYGILIKTKAKSLGLSGQEIIDVLNVKLSPDKVLMFIDGKRYLKAYHMNKKYWISIVLYHHADIKTIFSLIDESYEIVNRNLKK
ncbi:MAG: MmcQ/YjbR family DNA-binding protein [Anaeroplasmataceae bacterium]|nr:MmcQ/YjbR family DNA-binding protein [Anaeroplasmataceae bacterium]